MKNNYLLKVKLLCYGSVAISVILAILFETDVLPMGFLRPQTVIEFVVTYVMEFIAITFVWLSLRLLKFKSLQQWIIAENSKQTTRYSLFSMGRMALNCLPLLLNVVFYYLFVNTTFSGLIAIHLVALMFMLPNKKRMESELQWIASQQQHS